jgi:cytochrome c oxidase subunit 2
MSAGGAVAPGAGAGGGEPRHGIRIAIIWAIFTVIVAPLVIFVAGPHIPPFDRSVQSQDQHDVNVVLLALAVPIVGMVWVYFAYAATVFRNRGAEVVDGPPISGNPRVQIVWLAVTSVLVLGLATYGTVGLFGSSKGAGGGQGPAPLVKPPVSAHPLQIQVIGQQWLWTFRYPSYGGVETASLELPVDQWVQFNVTSLDVAHSFWAYELGVKADAIPGNNNVAYVKATHLGTFQVRCAELCGLWHPHMNGYGTVVTANAFQTWITARRIQFAPVTKQLPPYNLHYYPDPQRRAG